MSDHEKSRIFLSLSVISLLAGVLFFGVLLLDYWLGTGRTNMVVLATALLFAGIANSLALLIFHRMNSIGFEVGIWRWPGQDLRLYAEYWRIAPDRGWSRWVLTGAMLCFISAAAFLFSF